MDRAAQVWTSLAVVAVGAIALFVYVMSQDIHPGDGVVVTVTKSDEPPKESWRHVTMAELEAEVPSLADAVRRAQVQGAADVEGHDADVEAYLMDGADADRPWDLLVVDGQSYDIVIVYA